MRAPLHKRRVLVRAGGDGVQSYGRNNAGVGERWRGGNDGVGYIVVYCLFNPPSAFYSPLQRIGEEV